MLGATDHRIGAVAADITWNNLGTRCSRTTAATAWACSRSCGPATCSPPAFGDAAAVAARWLGDRPARSGTDRPAGCGRFAAELCRSTRPRPRRRSRTPALAGLLRRVQPGQRAQPDARTDAAHPGRAGLAVRAGRGRRERPRPRASPAPRCSCAGAPAATTRAGRRRRCDRVAKAVRHRSAARPRPVRPRSCFSAGRRRDLGHQRPPGEQHAAGRRLPGRSRARRHQQPVALTGVGPAQISAPAGGTPAAVTSLPGLGGSCSTRSAVRQRLAGPLPKRARPDRGVQLGAAARAGAGRGARHRAAGGDRRRFRRRDAVRGVARPRPGRLGQPARAAGLGRPADRADARATAPRSPCGCRGSSAISRPGTGSR